jgi:hypothetical protein
LIEERVCFHEEINILIFCAAIEHQEADEVKEGHTGNLSRRRQNPLVRPFGATGARQF